MRLAHPKARDHPSVPSLWHRTADGVLAQHAKLRATIVLQPAQKYSAPVHAHGNAARMSSAQLLKRVFDIDVERCECGGQLKILAAIEDLVVIVRILTHLGLPRVHCHAQRGGSARSTTQPDPKA